MLKLSTERVAQRDGSESSSYLVSPLREERTNLVQGSFLCVDSFAFGVLDLVAASAGFVDGTFDGDFVAVDVVQERVLAHVCEGNRNACRVAGDPMS
jgi:hypothetical protein